MNEKKKGEGGRKREREIFSERLDGWVKGVDREKQRDI